MKNHLAFVFICIVILAFCDQSCTSTTKTTSQVFGVDTPVVVQNRKDLFQAGRFYFGGQPDEETFRWLAGEGVTLVINIRTNEEMEKHNKEKYNETDLLKELGINYMNFPLGGKAGYAAQVVDTLSLTLNQHQDKAIIHCKSGGRVSYLWAAYLVKHKGLEIDDAVDICKRMKFSFALEDLLGYPVTIRKKDQG